MPFKKKKIGSVPNLLHRKEAITLQSLMRRTVILASIFLIFIIARRAIGFTVDTTQRLTKSTFEVVSKRFGTPLIKDDYGHINTLIVGVAGHNYRG
ncbi:MAG: hypothetical protein Q8O99_00920 [bacterium]|nr:hypothetical protein [bacterium]